MQQFSRVCMIADHDLRQIEYVCVFPNCKLSRFACGKCVQIGNHNHQQSDQSNVLNSKELYEFVSEKLSIRQKQQGMDYNHCEYLKELLLKLRNNGFNQFDDISLNILLNIDQQVGNINTQLLDQSNSINKNPIRIQELCNSQQQDYGLEEKIKDSKYKVITQDQFKGDQSIYSSAISNDFKFLVSGGTNQKLKIWNYSIINQSNQFNQIMRLRRQYLQMTLDYYMLEHIIIYTNLMLIKFLRQHTKNVYTKIRFQIFFVQLIRLYQHAPMIKLLQKQMSIVNNHYYQQMQVIVLLSDMIASSSDDKSIKIWNGNNGQLVLEKQFAHNNNYINQVLFIIKGNRLISLAIWSTIIWIINYESKQLEQQQQINDNNRICNISLMLNYQYISLVCNEYIKIYSIKGDYIKQFNHDVKNIQIINTIQPQSMKAIAIQGRQIFKICKVKLGVN